VNRTTRSLCMALGALVLGAAPAIACVNVGVYQDQPAKTLPSLQKKAGKNVKTVSTYLTVGRALDPKLVKLARTQGIKLIISWLPDKGADSAKAPGFRLSAIAAGKFDPELRALAAQIKTLPHGATVRPMPDPNTPWYAWSGTANGNRPGDYVRAWKHVRKVLVKTAGRKVRLLWSVYARSVPDTKQNALNVYFPGARQVDLVGADGYNFGTAQGLTWTAPADLFAPAYGVIQKLAKKPFWISETGSTARGGDEGAWIGALGQLSKTTMPELAGVVWYDVKDATGDFRVPRKGAAAAAFKAFVRTACK
jgi:mannan endo-1,4-beta-mannosidase